jgi:hypothetical protein
MKFNKLFLNLKPDSKFQFMPLPAVTIKVIFYHEKEQLALYFEFNQELKNLVKSIKGRNKSDTAGAN